MTDIRSINKNIGRSVLFAALAGIVLFFPTFSLAQPVTTAVLYPDIREPFRSVFMSIIKGIDESLGGNIEARALTSTDSAAEVLEWTRQNNIGSVVTLGNQAFTVASVLPREIPMVVGAVNMSPELLGGTFYGITLNPDPVALLQRLKTIVPKVTRVHVIYQREQDGWMIDKATRAAQDLGLSLHAVPAENLQEAANKYREILNNQLSDSDALWLPQDSAVLDEQAILPMILKEAWDRRLIVFSSNPSFVKKGVLFALYPDNYNMGRSLGAMARRLQAPGYRVDPAAQNIEALRDLLIAFNVRTAAHLDIKFSREEANSFDLVFPSR
ncbi:MAG: ABC transporter substrate-binding protein [Gammaproteobacteria bacterium]|nr:ABC transporter substrate-binding protein [Gammaproteobacteria bacterium]